MPISGVGPNAGMHNLVNLVCSLLEDRSASVRVQAAAALAAAAERLADSQGAVTVFSDELYQLLVAGNLDCASQILSVIVAWAG
jgi:2-polyprenyl-6-methoxyphenol hydroxylase-like FAD-dependent oxidoreductase